MKKLVALALALILALSLVSCGSSPKEAFEKFFKEMHAGMTQEEVRKVLGEPDKTDEGTYYDGTAYRDDTYFGLSFLGKKVDVCFSYSVAREITWVDVTFDPADNGDLKPFESELLEYCYKNYGEPYWYDAEEGSMHDYTWANEDFAIWLDSWVDHDVLEHADIMLSWMTREVWEEETGWK